MNYTYIFLNDTSIIDVASFNLNTSNILYFLILTLTPRTLFPKKRGVTRSKFNLEQFWSWDPILGVRLIDITAGWIWNLLRLIMNLGPHSKGPTCRCHEQETSSKILFGIILILGPYSKGPTYGCHWYLSEYQRTLFLT